ncbi:hypothetical protein SDC9_98414 [bioreactor metagenome]|uniref:GTP cyclohydrolase 1 type 2 n=1 Tax=bioreactor metagenome TaxID=1076179 RepID=A0A645ALE2_9ZZZZ|nr:Nif3-like dinuclear metal center hexameric protein [Oscillospiraceae bacterium]
MIAKDLYNHLEQDFRLSICDDDWSEMQMSSYITEQYQQRYMGLVTDNSDKIDYVYTAVFPSAEVIGKIISDNRKNVLLFLHHPMDFDINRMPVFTDIPLKTLKTFKERNISIYNLHAPLDANGKFSTTCNFAAALGIEMTGEFYKYHKVKIGVIGKTSYKIIGELQKRFENAVGHSVKLYQYGDATINGDKVALVAGGGNDANIYPFLRDMGINTYLTGIARKVEAYPPSVEAHSAAKECEINIIAGTHYSTEKFACIKMVEFFAQFGVPGEFVPGIPCMEDI